ncbi:MAG: glutamine-hydrolyzing GMP synthase, partial [Planctomycetota bacterium]
MSAEQGGQNGTGAAAEGGMKGGVLVVDYGTQYCQLIARRIREMGVYSRITVPERTGMMMGAMQPAAVILSGGPRSVYDKDAPKLAPEVLAAGVPLLGICYGMQLLSDALGGKVEASSEGREYGRTNMNLVAESPLMKGVREESVVWMSHGDKITALPDGFEVLARSEPCPAAAAEDRKRGIYALQFHPEVSHSEFGGEILRNFVLEIAGCPADWSPGCIVERKVGEIRELVGEDGEVVLGLSGGVDSSVAAVLVHRAIGPRLHCVFVDNGLLRKGEREGVETLFRDDYHMDLRVVDARERFLSELAGVTEPE